MIQIRIRIADLFQVHVDIFGGPGELTTCKFVHNRPSPVQAGVFARVTDYRHAQSGVHWFSEACLSREHGGRLARLIFNTLQGRSQGFEKSGSTKYFLKFEGGSWSSFQADFEEGGSR